MDLRAVVVRPVHAGEESRYQVLKQQHHYLGALPKIGETLWHVATWREEWVALASFSAAALKCAMRDHWIGWNFRQRYSRLKLIVNNRRFLILAPGQVPNLGSRVLALCPRRLGRDGEAAFSPALVLVETFVDPQGLRYSSFSGRWCYARRACRDRNWRARENRLGGA